MRFLCGMHVFTVRHALIFDVAFQWYRILLLWPSRVGACCCADSAHFASTRRVPTNGMPGLLRSKCSFGLPYVAERLDRLPFLKVPQDALSVGALDVPGHIYLIKTRQTLQFSLRAFLKVLALVPYQRESFSGFYSCTVHSNQF